MKVSVPEDLQGPDISLQEQSEGVLIRIDHPDGSVQSSLVRHGTSGKQPVRGQDYWTESDIEGIKAYVDEAILGGAW